MFVLVRLVDYLRVKPFQLEPPMKRLASIRQLLIDKFGNNVLKDVGLICLLYNIIEQSSLGQVYSGEGDVRIRVCFRVVVFRPFVGEAIEGVVLQQSATKGVRVSLGFFDEIYIPPSRLPAGAVFSVEEGCWDCPTEGEEELQSQFIDLDMKVRFRVCGVEYGSEEGSHDQMPPKPHLDTPHPLPRQETMRIVGSMKEDGLGPLAWWIES